MTAELAAMPREICSVWRRFVQRSLGLDERPPVFPAELIPGVHVCGVALLAAALLLGEGVVVVVHDEAEVLVVHDATVSLLVVARNCAGEL